MPSLWVKPLATSLAWLLSNWFISYFMALNLNVEFSPLIACENKFGLSLCPMWHWRECFTIINAFLMSKTIGYESSLTFEQWIYLLLHGTESQCGVFSTHSMWRQIWIIFMLNVNIRLWEVYNMITKNCWSPYSIGFFF
jgi:hypothetical protein